MEVKEKTKDLETAFEELEANSQINEFTVSKKFRMERIKQGEEKIFKKNETLRYKGKYRVIKLN
ncbi:MAG: hypothetical protein WC264_00480 [Candidatus Paceibacterota bacterium]|jgi:hypothetical protein